MSTPQPIQFLLHQLATNEGDRERFNKIKQNIEVVLNKETNELLFEVWISGFFNDHSDTLTVGAVLQNPPDIITEKIIRTCLSRVNGSDGDSVLGVFKSYHTQLSCYVVFDFELRNGKPLDTAIQALHDKMLELVPEYREFINNEK
jgi:hypothetical protein